jgi:hypothetical protein
MKNIDPSVQRLGATDAGGRRIEPGRVSVAGRQLWNATASERTGCEHDNRGELIAGVMLVVIVAVLVELFLSMVR